MGSTFNQISAPMQKEETPPHMQAHKGKVNSCWTFKYALYFKQVRGESTVTHQTQALQLSFFFSVQVIGLPKHLTQPTLSNFFNIFKSFIFPTNISGSFEGM